MYRIELRPGEEALFKSFDEFAKAVQNGVDVETRIGWAADVGEHKTSMLQDLESGKAMEIDALLTAVVEMGDMTGIDTPMLDTIHALAVQRAQNAGCYPA